MRKIIILGIMVFCAAHGFALDFLEINFNAGAGFATHVPTTTVASKTGFHWGLGAYYHHFFDSRDDLSYGFAVGALYQEDNVDYSDIYGASTWEWYKFKWLHIPVCVSLGLSSGSGGILAVDGGVFYNLPLQGQKETAAYVYESYSQNGQFGIKLACSYSLFMEMGNDTVFPFGFGFGLYCDLGFGNIHSAGTDTFAIFPRLGMTLSVPFFF